jgi:endonuclease/exonuclease/phosphatase (EEP) superfamily protein YafD
VIALLLAVYWRQRWRYQVLLLISMVIMAWPPGPRRAAAPAPNGPTLRLLSANVARQNLRDPAAVSAALAAVGADVVALVEANPAVVAAARAALPDLRAGADWSQSDGAYGVALFSRVAIVDEFCHQVDGAQILDVTLAMPARLRVLVVHPCPPVLSWGFAWRNRVLARIAQLSASSRVPVVVCGDFNLSPNSPLWDVLLVDGGLAASTVVPRTWPQLLRPVGIAIDHILVGGGAALGPVTTAWIPGSDHAAVCAEIGLTTSAVLPPPQ